MKQAETRLADLYVKVNHATWVQENWAEKYFERERVFTPDLYGWDGCAFAAGKPQITYP